MKVLDEAEIIGKSLSNLIARNDVQEAERLLVGALATIILFYIEDSEVDEFLVEFCERVKRGMENAKDDGIVVRVQ